MYSDIVEILDGKTNINNCCMYLPKKNNCSALNKIHSGCGTKMCPFYKTEAEQRSQMRKARRRCEKLGIQYDRKGCERL